MKNFLIIFLLVFLFSCGTNAETNTQNTMQILTQENALKLTKEQQKIHEMQTNFPVLDIFSRENLPMPKGYSFSGNIFISDNQDIMPLLPQNGDAKLAAKLIEKNLSEFSYNLDPNNEDYGVYFQNYFIGKYHAQIAYHMDIWPGNSEILDVKVHFPAFFTLSDNEQQDFFKKIENYGKIYKSFAWDFELDRSDIDAEKLQKFYNDFWRTTNNIAR